MDRTFDPEPTCQDCGADLGWPGSYSNAEEAVEYNCMACGMMEGVNYIEPSEMPTDYLHRLFTYTSRVDASIERDGNDPRFDKMRAALGAELDERGESYSEVSLTHRVHTNKRVAYDIEEQFPGFFTIGAPPEDAEYELGTPQEEMEWEALVGADEADRLAQWDDVTVEAL
jgi:hypothetical protein